MEGVNSVTRLGDLLDFGQLFLATINLPQTPPFFGNFRKGVKIYHFCSETNFWATFIDIWRFYLVTLGVNHFKPLSHFPPLSFLQFFYFPKYVAYMWCCCFLSFSVTRWFDYF